MLTVNWGLFVRLLLLVVERFGGLLVVIIILSVTTGQQTFGNSSSNPQMDARRSLTSLLFDNLLHWAKVIQLPDFLLGVVHRFSSSSGNATIVRYNENTIFNYFNTYSVF